MVQAWQEGLDDLLSFGDYPNETAEGTITLATGDRDYSKPADFKGWTRDRSFINRTNGDFMSHYPGGYQALHRDQLIPANYTGQPQRWCDSPTDLIYLDYIPTANENGDVFTFLYNKEVTVTATTDTFPFVDAAVRAMVPMIVQLYSRELKNEFDEQLYTRSRARALRHIQQKAD